MISQCASLIDEKDYCDEAQLLLSEYAKVPAVEFSEQLEFLEQWAMDDSQSSLLVTGEARSGKKTLLFEWLRRGRQNHPNWLFIPQFASVTPIYYNILYKTIVELRNNFKINQKVDLNQQKLRRYFKYWLQVTSDFLEKEYLGYQKQEIPKVIILIEGIDLCVDSKGNTVQPQFWLPSKIPRNIKLLLTTKNNDQTLVQNSLVLRHQISKQKKEKVIKGLNPKVQQLGSTYKQFGLNSLYLIDQMVSHQPNLTLTNSLVAIFSQYIDSVAQKDLNAEVIKSLLFTLTLTRKGLRGRELAKMVGISGKEWDLFLSSFSFCLVEAQGHFIICSKTMGQLIGQLVDPSRQKVKTYRHSIVRSVKKQSIRLRDLQEVVYQLLMSESYSELKEQISRVQNFIMLYTPLSKELLCQSWVKLELIEQFDPVYEYNKAIQSYTSHYYPKEEDLYKIIFQMCMFFKQYAEFQNPKTPAFRHPLIKGEVDSLTSIGIHEELTTLAMVGKNKITKLKPTDQADPHSHHYSKLDTNQSKNSTIKMLKDLKQKSRVIKAEDTPRSNALRCPTSQKATERLIQEDVSDEGVETTDMIRYSSFEQGKGFNVQELNVGIQSNQDKFRQHFLGEMKEYLENYFVPIKKSTYKDKYLAFEGEDSDNEEERCQQRGEKQFKVDLQKMKSSFLLKHFKQYLEESYHKTGQEVQYYYYKQWIWLQFPWLCQTIRHVYSNMLKQCLPGSIHFMSPAREFQLVRDVIKIARNAKENKLGIYNDKKLEVLSIRTKGHRNNETCLETTRKAERKERSTKKTEMSNVSKVRRAFQDSIDNCRLNTNRLDEQILKEKQEEARLLEKNGSRRLKGDASMPNLFVTETLQKDSRLLPSLKKSKFAIDKSRKVNDKENKQDSRDYTLIIRKFNEFKHENDMLVQKIEQARRLQEKMVDRSHQQAAALRQSIEQLETKKSQIQKNHSSQLQLGKKLQLIIKICDLNKMYGSETDYLSSYLDNLKKMIDCEETKINTIKQNINKIIHNGKIEIKQLRNKRKQLKHQKDQSAIPFQSIHTDSTNLRCTELGSNQIEEELKELNRSLRMKSKKTKSKTERRFLSAKDYDILEHQMAIIYGQTQNEAKIEQFSSKCQKVKELKLQNLQIRRELELKRKTLEAVRSQSNNQWQGEVRQKQIRTANQLVQKKKQLAQLKQRNQLLQNAMATLKV